MFYNCTTVKGCNARGGGLNLWVVSVAVVDSSRMESQPQNLDLKP